MAGKSKKKEVEVSEELETMRAVAGAMNEILFEKEKDYMDVESEDEDELRGEIEENAKDLTLEDKEDFEDEEHWDWLKEQGFLDHLEEKKDKGKDKAKKDDKKATPAKGKKVKEEEPEEPDEEEEEKPSKSKSKEKDSKKTGKAKEDDKPKKKSNLPARDFSTSNKRVVYDLWGKGKGETDVAKIHKKIKGAVKETTIKGWIKAWEKGDNLPAGCK